MKVWKHFCTITKHRWMVRKHCFAVGLYKQGMLHDLSKYSFEEFWTGAKYYQGNRSPNTAEREVYGYSLAWMHHKGRNKHHYEYWTDLNLKTATYEPVPMPPKYFVEMIMDRIAACKIYNKGHYTQSDPLNYFTHAMESRDGLFMHEETKQRLIRVLTMLSTDGEKETFKKLKAFLKGEIDL